MQPPETARLLDGIGQRKLRRRVMCNDPRAARGAWSLPYCQSGGASVTAGTSIRAQTTTGTTRFFVHLRSSGPVRRSGTGGSEWLPVAEALVALSLRLWPASSRIPDSSKLSLDVLRGVANRNQSNMPSIATLRHRRRFGVLGRRAPLANKYRRILPSSCGPPPVAERLTANLRRP